MGDTKKITYGEWWEENQHLNIFKIPNELKAEGTTGNGTIHHPYGNQTLVQTVQYHADGNYSIIDEKII